MELYAWGLQVQALYHANLVSSTFRLRNHIHFWIANDHEISFFINYIENTFFFYISRSSLGHCFFSSFNTHIVHSPLVLWSTRWSPFAIYIFINTLYLCQVVNCQDFDERQLLETKQSSFNFRGIFLTAGGLWLWKCRQTGLIRRQQWDNGLLTQYSNQAWKQYWVSSTKPLVFQSK